MTREDKQLLLTDLCARLPHGVMCDRLGHPLKLVGVRPNKEFALEFDRGEYMPTEYTVEDVKPYLRPLSSMTEEENIEYNEICLFNGASIALMSNVISSYETINWLNAHHFDYRGLIEKGLALEAPKGMYKEK